MVHMTGRKGRTHATHAGGHGRGLLGSFRDDALQGWEGREGMGRRVLARSSAVRTAGRHWPIHVCQKKTKRIQKRFHCNLQRLQAARTSAVVSSEATEAASSSAVRTTCGGGASEMKCRHS